MRNWIGAFFGAFPGILSSGYMPHMVQPVAAFFITFGIITLGVIVGWWNKEIRNSIVAGYRHAKVERAKMDKSFTGFLTFLAELCGISSSLILGAINRFGAGKRRTVSLGERAMKAVSRGLVHAIFAFLAFWPAALRFLIKAPGRILSWDQAHEMNRAIVVECFAGLVVAGSFVYGVYSAFATGYWMTGPRDSPASMALLAGMLSACGLVAYQAKLATARNAQRHYYRELHIVNTMGYTALFLYYALQFVRSIAGVALFGALLLCWLCFSMLALIFVFMGGNVLTYGLYAIYRASRRRGHLLCMVTTLVVTGISWMIFHARFEEPLVLWLVAFGTGAAAGAFTEFLSFMTLRYKMVIISAKKDDGMKIMDFFERIVFLWGTRNKIAQALRTLLFGTPFLLPPRILRPDYEMFA